MQNKKIKKIPLFVTLGLMAALLGALVGAISAGFLHFIDWGQHLLWERFTPQLSFQTLIICTLGGLLIGLCQRYFGDHPKGINEAIAELRGTGRMAYDHLFPGMLTASTSLIFGASLGPEAAIMGLVGGLGTLAGDIMGWFRARFGIQMSSESDGRLVKYLRKWPTIIAFLIGGVVLVKLLSGLYGGGFLDLPDPSLRLLDMVWAVPLGIIGAAGGRFYLASQTQMSGLLAPLDRRPVWRGVVGGFCLGLVALFLPLVLFSGQHSLQLMYEQAELLGFWVLLLTALARLLLTSLMLSSGWKGGQFLPIMFGGAALGLAFSVLFPIIPAPVAVLSVMGALVAVVLPKPLFALAIMVMMFPFEYAGVSVVSIGVVMFVQYLYSKVSLSGTQKVEVSLAGE